MRNLGKERGSFTSLQAELEANFITIETRLALALERNDHLERDMVKVKEELNTSLIWAKSSKLLSSITSQNNYNKKGIGSLNITHLYNTHSNYVYISDNLLCLHFCKNSHLKKHCHTWKESQENFLVYFTQKRARKGGPSPIPKSLKRKRPKCLTGPETS